MSLAKYLQVQSFNTYCNSEHNTCLPTRRAGKRNPVEPASTWNLYGRVSATILAIFVICRTDKISHVLQAHSGWEQYTMCQSIPCHETLITNNTGCCTTMSDHDTKMCWAEERRRGTKTTRESGKKKMMITTVMQTFLHALTCACPYI